MEEMKKKIVEAVELEKIKEGKRRGSEGEVKTGYV